MNTSRKSRAFSASKPTLLCALGILCLPFCSQAQQNKLSVAAPEQITVKRGGSVTEILKVSVLPGFHVNSDKPRDEYLIPLKLTWSSGPLEAETVSYPKPEEAQVGKDKLLVFTGDFEIRTDFKAPGSAPAGQAAMTGRLRYQACNGQMCFRPSSVEIHAPIVIE